MTQQELEEQSKQAVIAYLQDSSIGLEYSYQKDEIPGVDWFEKTDCNFNFDLYYFRIAQPKRWYRVAKCKDRATGKIFTVTADPDFGKKESVIEQRSDFIKWLTERVEY